MNSLIVWVFSLLKIDASDKLVSATKALVIAALAFIGALSGGWELGVFDVQPAFGDSLGTMQATAYTGGALTSLLISVAINWLLKWLSK